MCHPTILESGTRMGEHGVRLKPDGLKQSIYELEHSICDSKHSFWQPDDSNTLFCSFYDDGRKNDIIRAWRTYGGLTQNGRTSSEM